MKEDASTSPKDSAARPSGHRNFNVRHLLAPTDFSPASERAVEYAVQLARRLGARLTLLHVVPPPSDLSYSVGGGVSTEQIEEWQKEAEKKLAEQLARAKLEYEDATRFSEPGTVLVMKSSELPRICQLISWLYRRRGTPAAYTSWSPVTPRILSSMFGVRHWLCGKCFKRTGSSVFSGRGRPARGCARCRPCGSGP